MHFTESLSLELLNFTSVRCVWFFSLSLVREKLISPDIHSFIPMDEVVVSAKLFGHDALAAVFTGMEAGGSSNAKSAISNSDDNLPLSASPFLFTPLY